MHTLHCIEIKKDRIKTLKETTYKQFCHNITTWHTFDNIISSVCDKTNNALCDLDMTVTKLFDYVPLHVFCVTGLGWIGPSLFGKCRVGLLSKWTDPLWVNWTHVNCMGPM